jgi:hypothetical protein
MATLGTSSGGGLIPLPPNETALGTATGCGMEGVIVLAVTVELLPICAGAGTNPVDDGLGGSSNVGTGKTGAALLLPVPEGPPPPTRRRDPTICPAASACATICCCRAKTSRPLVT